MKWNTNKNKMKQVICMRTDLGMTAGKIASRAAHASILFLANKFVTSSFGGYHTINLNAKETEWLLFDDEKCKIHKDWKFGGMKKIVLEVYDYQHLFDTFHMA